MTLTRAPVEAESSVTEFSFVTQMWVLPDTLNEDSCDAPDEQADASTTND
jgi:hypothetical protein